MKKIILGTLLSAALLAPIFFTNPTLGDEAQREALAGEVVGAMNMINQVKRTLPMMQQQVLMVMANKYPDVSEKTLMQIKKISDDFTIELVTKAEPALTKIIADTFTEEELVDISAFYKSKSGRTLLEKQPILSQAMMQWVNGSMMQSMQDIDKKVEKLLEAEKN